MPTVIPAPSQQPRLPLPGAALTRRAVTVITAAIVVLTFAFSLGNVTRLCLALGITGWIAWLVAPAVDLSVAGLLTGIRFLSLHGYTSAQLARPRRLLRFCGLLTLALNTAGALCHRQFGTALVDAVGPPSSSAGAKQARGCSARSTPSAHPPRTSRPPRPPPCRPRCSPSPCSPGPATSTPHTAPPPAAPSPATPCAPSCGSAATAPAPWSPPSAPKRPPTLAPAHCKRRSSRDAPRRPS